MAKFYRVVEAFATTVDGIPKVYTEGMIVSGDDPAVKGRDAYFVDVQRFAEQSAAGATETASAAPGERRARSVAKRTVAKKAAQSTPGPVADSSTEPSQSDKKSDTEEK